MSPIQLLRQQLRLIDDQVIEAMKADDLVAEEQARELRGQYYAALDLLTDGRDC